MADKKDVAVKEENPLAALGISVDELTKDSRLGGEIGIQDIAIPYLYTLQSNSPQVNPDHDKYIQGATASMFYLTVLEKVFEGREKGVMIIPCHYERLITEWVDRDEGGGLVRSYPSGDPITTRAKADDKGRLRLPNNHLLVDTAYHYIMVNEPATDKWYEAIMPMKSTHLKASRKLNNEINTTKIPGTDVKIPRFLYTWNVKTKKEQKDTNVWNVPVFAKGEMCTKDLYEKAKRFSTLAAESMLRRPEAEAKVDDEVPF